MYRNRQFGHPMIFILLIFSIMSIASSQTSRQFNILKDKLNQIVNQNKFNDKNVNNLNDLSSFNKLSQINNLNQFNTQLKYKNQIIDKNNNIVLGDPNQLNGKQNAVIGQFNQISGDRNFVRGNGNIIMTPTNNNNFNQLKALYKQNSTKPSSITFNYLNTLFNKNGNVISGSNYLNAMDNFINDGKNNFINDGKDNLINGKNNLINGTNNLINGTNNLVYGTNNIINSNTNTKINNKLINNNLIPNSNHINILLPDSSFNNIKKPNIQLLESDLNTSTSPHITNKIPIQITTTTSNPTPFTNPTSTTGTQNSNNPTSSNPISSNPTSSNPSLSTPTSSTPTSSTPTSSYPTSSNPTSSNPASSYPATTTPTSSNLAATTPTSSNPTTTTPTSSNLAATTPTSSNPATTTSTSSNPATTTPTSSNPATITSTSSMPTLSPSSSSSSSQSIAIRSTTRILPIIVPFFQIDRLLNDGNILQIIKIIKRVIIQRSIQCQLKNAYLSDVLGRYNVAIDIKKLLIENPKLLQNNNDINNNKNRLLVQNVCLNKINLKELQVIELQLSSSEKSLKQSSNILIQNENRLGQINNEIKRLEMQLNKSKQIKLALQTNITNVKSISISLNKKIQQTKFKVVSVKTNNQLIKKNCQNQKNKINSNNFNSNTNNNNNINNLSTNQISLQTNSKQSTQFSSSIHLINNKISYNKLISSYQQLKDSINTINYKCNGMGDVVSSVMNVNQGNIDRQNMYQVSSDTYSSYLKRLFNITIISGRSQYQLIPVRIFSSKFINEYGFGYKEHEKLTVSSLSPVFGLVGDFSCSSSYRSTDIRKGVIRSINNKFMEVWGDDNKMYKVVIGACSRIEGKLGDLLPRVNLRIGLRGFIKNQIIYLHTAIIL